MNNWDRNTQFVNNFHNVIYLTFDFLKKFKVKVCWVLEVGIILQIMDEIFIIIFILSYLEYTKILYMNFLKQQYMKNIFLHIPLKTNHV